MGSSKQELLDLKQKVFKEFDIKKIELWRWEGWGQDLLKQTIRVEN